MISDSGIEQTHQLIDKIELRVKHFLKTQSIKQIQPLMNSNIDYNRPTSLYSKKEKGESNIFNQIENLIPQKSIITQQSRTSDCQIPLLKEIQEIDQSYKMEIEQLNNTINQLKNIVEELKDCVNSLNTQLELKQKEIDQYKSERNNSTILIQTLRDENTYLTKEIQQIMNSQNNGQPKISTLTIEVQEEKKKSERLQNEINEIKSRVEKQRDSAKSNSEIQTIEKLVKQLENSQEQHQRQNQQFMKFIVQYMDRQQNQEKSISQQNTHKKSKSSLKKK